MYHYSIQLSWPSEYGSGYGYTVDSFASMFLLSQKDFLKKISEDIRVEIQDMLYMCYPKQTHEGKRLITKSENHNCILTITAS